MQSQLPFFVVGAQRSGTTMLRLMLNAHPRIAVPHESGFIPEFHARLRDYGDLSVRDNAARLLDDIARSRHAARGKLVFDSEAVLAAPIAGYADLIRSIFCVYAARRGKPRWGDKTPGYGTHLEVLWELFPGCTIVHIVRDGRDVALSNRGVSWGIRDLTKVARQWRWETVVTRKLGRMLGAHYLEVRYENLVQHAEAELRRICAHIGEDYDASMLHYHETARDEVPAESLQWHASSIRPPDSDKIAMWRYGLTETDRIIFEEHAGDALAEFGYLCERRARTWRSRIRSIAYTIQGR